LGKKMNISEEDNEYLRVRKWICGSK
jgi:hypothetical protein